MSLLILILLIHSWWLYIHLNQGLVTVIPPSNFPPFFLFLAFFSGLDTVLDMAALDNHTTYNYTSSINWYCLYTSSYSFYSRNTIVDIAAWQFVGPSLLLYPNPFMSFILFLCYVTVRLTALQFIGLSVTLLNHYPHLFYVWLTYTPSTPSPTDGISGGEPMYLVIPFPTPGKPYKVARETTDFFPLLTKKNLMKEGCSQEEHQQQNDIWYFKSNTIGCNRRGSRCNRRVSRCNKRGNRSNRRGSRCNRRLSRCNKRGTRSNRRGSRCDRRGSRYHVKAGFDLTAVEHLNGAVIVNNVHGVVVLHGTQAIQL